MWRAELLVQVALLALGQAGALSPDEEAMVLLQAPSAWPNWEDALARPECGTPGTAWSDALPPCGTAGNPSSIWRGVRCKDGRVAELRLSGCGLQGTLPPALAKLERLDTLDLSLNALTGGVPEEWTRAGALPALGTLQLASNNLTAALDDFTPAASGFIAALSFNVSRNAFNQGTIPAGWYSRTLQLLDISYNGVSGPLPVEWGLPKEVHENAYPSALPSLQRLAIEGNNISGPAEPWPGGGATVFSPNFLCTGKPGNPLLQLIPPPPPLDDGSGSSSSGRSGSGSGLSGGAIAGIVMGSLAGAALLALAGFAVAARRRKKAAAAAQQDAKGMPDGLRNDEDLDKKKHGSLQDSAEGGNKLGAAAGLGPGPVSAASLASTGLATPQPLPTVRLPSSTTSGVMPLSPFAAARAGSGSDVFASDTDSSQLPSDWNMVDFSELQVSRALGKGSFGTVFLATYCHTTVAVKMLGSGGKEPGVSDSLIQRDLVRQLGREVAVMSKLRHTNVCLYMGACLEPPCLIMECCARQSLDELLARGLQDSQLAQQLRWPRLLSMALGAARGMAYLHSRQPPVYHRDLKAANLLVTATWQVKVSDYGMSKLLQDDEHMSTQCLQNPRWLAPEVLAGQAGGLPADVWAFGTILYEIASWKPPFEGINPYQIINMVLQALAGSGLVLPLADQLPAGPLAQYGAYAQLVNDCWERDPQRRPTFAEVVERLRVIMQTEMRQSNPSGSLASSKPGSEHASPQPTSQLQPREAAPVGREPQGPALQGEAGKPQGPAPQGKVGAARGATSFDDAWKAAASQAFQGPLRGSTEASPFSLGPAG